MSRPIALDEIIECFKEIGADVQVGALKNRVISRRGGIPIHYKSDTSCRETIQRIIENHCPESDNYREDRIAYFRRVGHGLYALLPESEWRNQTRNSKGWWGQSCTRDAAKQMIYLYYKSHRSELPESITKQRETILQQVLSGVEVAVAFKNCAQ